MSRVSKKSFWEPLILFDFERARNNFIASGISLLFDGDLEPNALAAQAQHLICEVRLLALSALVHRLQLSQVPQRSPQTAVSTKFENPCAGTESHSQPGFERANCLHATPLVLLGTQPAQIERP